MRNVSPFKIERLSRNEYERQGRVLLVAICKEMLAGEISYVEGAVVVLGLRDQIGGVADHDEDFMSFVAIASETDHLPLEAQRRFWDAAALKRLEPECEKIKIWADSSARKSCENLIFRFSSG